MDLSTFVKGTCKEFCPSKERKMRTKEKLLHFYELHPPVGTLQPIKCFSRSAAGTETPRQSDLRTFDTLLRTVEYLLECVLMDDRKPYHFKYDFIFDRLRSVRQEIVIQNLNESETIQLLEPIIMFLSFSSYELCTSSIDIFDPKICSQHLQECLKKLLYHYDELNQHYGDECPNRKRNQEFCESLYLIFNLGNVDALNRAIRLRRKASVNGGLLRMCSSMSLQYFVGNFYNVIRTMKLLPRILSGLAVLWLQKIRREILMRFSIAYHSPILTVPLNWVAKLLLYDDVKSLVADCKHYNIQVSLDSQSIKFNKSDFDRNTIVIKSRHEQFADNLLVEMSTSYLLFHSEMGK